jgi:hypothetical protein
VSDSEINKDQFLLLMDGQLRGINSSLLVCKWPIILTSCFFITMLSWDVAGDQGGWLKASWVPMVGVAMAMLIWVWDHILISDGIAVLDWSRHLLSSHRRLQSTNIPSLEIVQSSLHPSSSAEGLPIEEGGVANQITL